MAIDLANIAESDILKLDINQRVELIGKIWNTIIENPELLELSEKQRQYLEECLASADKNPEEGQTREDFIAEMRTLLA